MAVARTIPVHIAVDETGDVLELQVKQFAHVKDVKALILEKLGVAVRQQRLVYRGNALQNSASLHNEWIDAGATLHLTIMNPAAVACSGSGPFIEALGHGVAAPGLHRLLKEARISIARGSTPKLSIEGEGGTYFLSGTREGAYIAAFKPRDEEAFGPANPKRLQGKLGQTGLRKGIRSGEAYLREVAAYVLDRDQFAGVPPTMVVEAAHPAFNNMAGKELVPKVGSFQQFVHYDELAGDLAPAAFPVSEVHKIGILDIRVVNCDRNDANILVKRGAKRSDFTLIPIDHGYSMPDTLEIGWCDWVWYDWPQAKRPFDAAALAYIAAIDVAADCHALAELGVRPECIANVMVCSTLLKMCAAAGMCLYDIASLIVRQDLDKPSPLEHILERSLEAAQVHLQSNRAALDVTLMQDLPRSMQFDLLSRTKWLLPSVFLQSGCKSDAGRSSAPVPSYSSPVIVGHTAVGTVAAPQHGTACGSPASDVGDHAKPGSRLPIPPPLTITLAQSGPCSLVSMIPSPPRSTPSESKSDDVDTDSTFSAESPSPTLPSPSSSPPTKLARYGPLGLVRVVSYAGSSHSMPALDDATHEKIAGRLHVSKAQAKALLGLVMHMVRGNIGMAIEEWQKTKRTPAASPVLPCTVAEHTVDPISDDDEGWVFESSTP